MDEQCVDDILIVHAREYARQRGYHLLELVGLPTALRRMAVGTRPLSRTMPVWPAYYRASEDALASALTKASAWYLTPFDGDTTLI
jgi:hypothetical protein